jgi:spermidine synthase
MSSIAGLAVVAVAGFVSLSYEILWFRVFSFTALSAPSVFGLLLGAYLAGLAAGALLSRRVVASSTEYPAVRQLRIVAGGLGAAAVTGFAVVPSLARLASHGAWPAGLLLVFAAATMFGIVLPLVSHLGIAPSDAVGARLSYLYLANILGSALGCWLTGFVLTDLWTVAGIARALALMGIGIAGVVAMDAERRPAPAPQRRTRMALVVASTLAAAALVSASTRPLFAHLYERLLYKQSVGDYPAFSDVVETPSGIITVTPDLEVYGGGVYDGYISTDLVEDPNLIVRAYALAAMREQPSRVLEIGLSTGAWARVLADLPGVEHLTTVEINPGYIGLIARHDAVRSLLHDPRVAVVIDDGRRWLARHPDERFDAIVMNSSYHWRAHATNLLSSEFMQLARAHLRPGGVFYFNTTGSLDVLKTALTAFPYGLRCLNFIAVSETPLAFDSERWSALLRGLRRDDGRLVFDSVDARARARLDTLVQFGTSLDRAPVAYGLESRASVLARLGQAGIITDDNMLSEWRGSAFGPPVLPHWPD